MVAFHDIGVQCAVASATCPSSLIACGFGMLAQTPSCCCIAKQAGDITELLRTSELPVQLRPRDDEQHTAMPGPVSSRRAT